MCVIIFIGEIMHETGLLHRHPLCPCRFLSSFTPYQVSVAARIRSIDLSSSDSSGNIGDGNTVVLRTPPGSLLGGAVDLGVATGLPFHLDGPFFVKDSGPHRPHRTLVLTEETKALAAEWQLPRQGGGRGAGGHSSSSESGGSSGGYMAPEQRKIIAAERASANSRRDGHGQGGRNDGSSGNGSGYPSDSSFGMLPEAEHAVGKWNEALLEAAMLELVPSLLTDLRDALRPK